MTDATTSATTPSQPSSKTPLDKSFYTWSSFFSILTGSASPSDKQKYFHIRDTLNEKADCERCENDKRWLFKNSPIVRFMQQNIDLLNPAGETARITEKNVYCRTCGPETAQSGGFDPKYGILVCANKLRNRGHLEDTLTHEMVHAYDHLRYHLNPMDLRHAACMEIRAAALSGECRWVREFFTRGQWRLTQQMQECVRRRAALSVAGRPGCKDDVQAAKVVNEVWESCFNDTRPFDEIYR